MKPPDNYYYEVFLIENTWDRFWRHCEVRRCTLSKKLRCVPLCPFPATVVTLRSLLITLLSHFSLLGFRDTRLIMPVKQFNSTLCQRNTDGCLISFNSAFSGKLSFNTNTWMEPHWEARARMFTVNDVNMKLKVRDREEEPEATHTTDFK